MFHNSDGNSGKTARNTTFWIWVLFGAFLLFGSFGLGQLVSHAAPAPPAQAGTGEISGEIQFHGTKPHLARINMAKDPECIRENQGREVYVQDGAVNANDTLPNAFVYVKSGLQQSSYPPPSQPVTLDQQGCIYVPHVLGIVVGQQLKVVNSDFTTHNIHITPKNNPAWNVSQPAGAAPAYVKFERSEVMVPVRCNEHPWMQAYIGVVSNPYYDVTGPEGKYTLKGLPAGTYTIETWTAKFGTQEKTVTVRANQTTTQNFSFENR